MTWRIEIKPSAEKQYLKLDPPTRRRIKEAFSALEQEANPLLSPRVRPLTAKLKGDYRIRIGSWRILFTPDRKTQRLSVYAILPRSDAY
jgi:mRNA interferase RelE/StbE